MSITSGLLLWSYSTLNRHCFPSNCNWLIEIVSQLSGKLVPLPSTYADRLFPPAHKTPCTATLFLLVSFLMLSSGDSLVLANKQEVPQSPEAVVESTPVLALGLI